jgi:hypothetical protein
MKSSASVRLLLVTTVLAPLVLGCSKSNSGRIPVYPTSGKVTFKGQPVEGAEIALYGLTPELAGPGTVPPVGVTDASGVFYLRSFDPDDGAPAGKFNVTIVWPDAATSGGDSEMQQRKDRLQGRYSDPKKSGLTVDVPEGGGELPPFEL